MFATSVVMPSFRDAIGSAVLRLGDGGFFGGSISPAKIKNIYRAQTCIWTNNGGHRPPSIFDSWYVALLSLQRRKKITETV